MPKPHFIVLGCVICLGSWVYWWHFSPYSFLVCFIPWKVSEMARVEALMTLSPIPPPESLVWLTCTLKLLLQGQISSEKKWHFGISTFFFSISKQNEDILAITSCLAKYSSYYITNPPSLIEHIRVGMGALPFTLKPGQHQRKTSAQPCLAGDQLIVENLL